MSIQRPRPDRLATRIGIFALCVMFSAQTGCGFRPLACLFSGGDCSNQQTTESPAVYSYQDGWEVGREYARKYGLQHEVTLETLPEELRESDLGHAFEIGCREGINSMVRRRRPVQRPAVSSPKALMKTTPVHVPQSVVEPISMTPSTDTIETTLDPQFRPAKRFTVNKSGVIITNRSVTRSQKPLSKQLPANRVRTLDVVHPTEESASEDEPDETVVEAITLEGEDKAMVDQLFAESAEMEKESPLLRAHSVPAPSKTTPEKSTESKSPVKPQKQGLVLSAIPAPATANKNENAEDGDSITTHTPQSESVTHQQEMIKLTATPGKEIDDTASTRKKNEPAKQPARKILPPPLSKSKLPGKTIVEKKTGSIRKLRAVSGHPDSRTSETRFINAGHRLLSEQKTDPSANETTSSSIDVERTVPVPASSGKRLPATGPNLEEKLRSPFNSDQSAPRSQEFLPRQAGPDQDNVYR